MSVIEVRDDDVLVFPADNGLSVEKAKEYFTGRGLNVGIMYIKGLTSVFVLRKKVSEDGVKGIVVNNSVDSLSYLIGGELNIYDEDVYYGTDTPVAVDVEGRALFWCRNLRIIMAITKAKLQSGRIVVQEMTEENLVLGGKSRRKEILLGETSSSIEVICDS